MSLVCLNLSLNRTIEIRDTFGQLESQERPRGLLHMEWDWHITFKEASVFHPRLEQDLHSHHDSHLATERCPSNLVSLVNQPRVAESQR